MRKEERLRRRRDFAESYRRGRAYGNNLLVIRVHSNTMQVTRFGFVAGKTIGGAVVRNRVKRRLREAARSLNVHPGVDIVVGAKRPAAEAAFADLQRSLKSLLRRAGALADEGAGECGRA